MVGTRAGRRRIDADLATAQQRPSEQKKRKTASSERQKVPPHASLEELGGPISKGTLPKAAAPSASLNRAFSTRFVNQHRKWRATAPEPERNPKTGELSFSAGQLHDDIAHLTHFESICQSFRPNLTPAEVLRGGAFGGGYFRPIKSIKTKEVYTEDWYDLPDVFFEGLDIENHVTSEVYDPKVNKFKVACGQCE